MSRTEIEVAGCRDCPCMSPHTEDRTNWCGALDAPIDSGVALRRWIRTPGEADTLGDCPMISGPVVLSLAAGSREGGHE
jgi:hypothetical protein